MIPNDPAERHRYIGAQFTALVRGTADWGAPSPVSGWSARDVVAHLIEWFPAFLAACDVQLPQAVPVEVDPEAAWIARTTSVQALLDDPQQAERELSHPIAGTGRLADTVDRFYTADVFMHSWDLARASGQPYELDPEFAATLLAGMQPIEDLLRGSGQYGPAIAVPETSPVQDRLIGFIGRDPAWRPDRSPPVP